MIYWEIFLANFTANIFGYGGGPATIPLLEYEVVHRYEWFTVAEFSEMVALGNGLPGPIATKLAGYVGYDQAGVLGAAVGVFAAVAPSMMLMIALLSVLFKYKDSPKVIKLTRYIRPTIAVLLGVMAYNFFKNSYDTAGLIHTLIVGGISFIALERLRYNPVFVVLAALLYGAIFLG